jgi:hypothetical protein
VEPGLRVWGRRTAQNPVYMGGDPQYFFRSRAI